MLSSEFILEAEIKPYEFYAATLKNTTKILNDNCSQALGMITVPLYRGMVNHTEPVVIIDPVTGSRKSQNTSNHYTVLMDNSPYMQGWPKRRNSLVCSTDFYYAVDFSYSGGKKGELYALFPFNGAKIAVCPARDLWETPITLPEFDLSYSSEYSNDWQLNNFNSFLSLLGMPDSYEGMQRWVKTDEFKNRLAQYNSTVVPERFIEYLQFRLSPTQTKMQLLSVPEFISAAYDSRECWISDKVVAVRYDMYKRLVHAANIFGIQNLKSFPAFNPIKTI